MPLALGFVLSLVLAYQAFDARREHRAAARGVARDHAGFAAYLIASSVDRRVREALLYGFYPVDLALGRGEMPGPADLRVEPEASRCVGELDSDARRYFRYDPRTDEIRVDGPHDAGFARWVRTTIAVEPTTTDLPLGFRHAVAVIGESRSLVAYRRWDEEHGGLVYGFESCWRTSDGNAFERAVATTQAFSPTLVGNTPNDSLFTLAARDADGELVYGERWTRPTPLYAAGDFYGTIALEPARSYAGVELRVTLLPHVAERLVEGGLPTSRLPLAFGLLSMNGLLMWLAVRQLRRGHELVSLRGRFVRNVSHELRTPLQQILLFTDLLRSGRLDEGPKRAQALDIMHTETRRLIELVRNVLRFSSGPDVELRTAEVDLAAVVRETVEGFRPLASSRGAEIVIDEPSRPRVVADPAAVKRVLINLLDNAVKYGPAGQRIVVRVCASGEWGELSVADRGPGIPSEEQERIWEAFRRLDREDAGATAGSGIGLSLVRRLVEAMSGTVGLTDAPAGEGACFVVRLPLVREAS